MMRSILEAAGHKTGVIGTIGVLYGDTLVQTDNTTPENYEVQKFMRQMVDAGCEYCVMEVSSIGLKDHRVAGFTFELGLFTNFSEDHIGGAEHKDMAEYMACKSMLFRMCRTGIINIDDPNYTGIIKNHTCNIVTYGYDKSADFVAHGEELVTTPGFLGVRFSVTGKLNFTVDVAIPGKFNVYNALCAITACSVLNIPVTAMQQGLKTVKVKGRVEPVPMPGRFHSAHRLCAQRRQHAEHFDNAARLSPEAPHLHVRRGGKAPKVAVSRWARSRQFSRSLRHHGR